MKTEEKYKTADERARAFAEFCDKRKCGSCELSVHGGRVCECAFRWLALEAEDETPEPCPFCGGECRVKDGFPHDNVVSCTKCDYVSGGTYEDSKAAAIAAHNRVARAVRAAKESEANNG